METVTGKEIRDAITTAPTQTKELLGKVANYLDDNNEATIQDLVDELVTAIRSGSHLQPLKTTQYNTVTLDVRNDGRIMIPSSVVKRLGLAKYNKVELDLKLIKGESKYD